MGVIRVPLDTQLFIDARAGKRTQKGASSCIGESTDVALSASSGQGVIRLLKDVLCRAPCACEIVGAGGRRLLDISGPKRWGDVPHLF